MRISSRFKVATAICLTLIAAALAAGCGDNSDDSSASGNQTDAMFVSGMIPHHQSAIEMAELALDNSSRAEIRGLADNIIAAQTEEIAKLNELDKQLPQPKSSMMEGSDMTTMQNLRNSSDEEFDRAFLQAMIPHHESAVTMAEKVQRSGENADVAELADSIVKAQTLEIAEMKRWGEAWFGSAFAAGDGSSGAVTMNHSDME